ncbi:MAG TPA: hypothetical protein VL358_09735 [Caulobacteraceae bacterium]|jgi:hypothetical protein|nr:hypothetical protein [Caulobacteraceae bacterium]
MKIAAISLAALSLAGCAYPVSSIGQGAEAGHLRFVGPAGLAVRVDGQDRGALADTRSLIVDVSPGRHLVEEISSGRVVLHREYEIGTGSTVEIKGENN